MSLEHHVVIVFGVGGGKGESSHILWYKEANHIISVIMGKSLSTTATGCAEEAIGELQENLLIEDHSYTSLVLW